MIFKKLHAVEWSGRWFEPYSEKRDLNIRYKLRQIVHKKYVHLFQRRTIFLQNTHTSQLSLLWGSTPSIRSDGGTFRFFGIRTWPKSTKKSTHQMDSQSEKKILHISTQRWRWSVKKKARKVRPNLCRKLWAPRAARWRAFSPCTSAVAPGSRSRRVRSFPEQSVQYFIIQIL